jgi:hypothetical protein
MTYPSQPVRVLASAALVFLGGCESTAPTLICSQAGCSSQLSVSLQDQPTGAYRVEVQAPGISQAVDCPDATRCARDLFFLNVTAEVVTVIVTTERGTVRHVVRPTYVSVRPNGPNCTPECWHGRVRVPIPA